ncbi:MAG: HDOD domain-containing protein [Gammaproteobacteria bacterium]
MSTSSLVALSKRLDAGSLVSTIRMLPPLPDVAQKILDKFSDEFISAQDIANIVENDPAISARLFGLANSAYFGLPKPVSDMREVVSRVLGPDTVRSIAFALAADQTFDLSDCSSFDSRRFWHRSLHTAASARRIAKATDILDSSERDFSYLAGLCHNLGLLAVACCYPSDINRILLRHAADSEVGLDELCLDQFGFRVSDITFELAFQWGLPDSIIDAYRCLSVGSANGNLLATVLDASIQSARHLEQTPDSTTFDDVDMFVSEHVAEVLKLTPERLQKASIGTDKERKAAESTLRAMVSA